MAGVLVLWRHIRAADQRGATIAAGTWQEVQLCPVEAESPAGGRAGDGNKGPAWRMWHGPSRGSLNITGVVVL